MHEDLRKFVDRIKAERRYVSFDEAATKQGIILPLLAKLGWDCFNVDEVSPEYVVEERRVDFALRIGSANKVFIEAKKPAEDLERHQKQLLDYSFKEGVRLAVLTNGTTWWFYLPLNEGSWEDRKYFTIDLEVQPSDEIASKFIDFLSRDNVKSGEATKNAECARDNRNKENKLKETLPRAFDKMLSDAGDGITDLLAGTTEQICGFRPDPDMVALFLKDRRGFVSKEGPNQAASKVRTPILQPGSAISQDGEYSGRSIERFEFLGKKYEVSSWIDLLLALCELLKNLEGHNFEKSLALVGKKRPYFSKNNELLRKPRLVDGTDIYLETNLSANSIVRLARDLIALFGYKPSELQVFVK